MAQVKWTEQTLKDVEEIGQCIEKVSFQYAKEQVEAIFEKVNQLENYPLSGRPVPELKDPTIRQLLCGNYRIIYEVETEQYPIILTVHHQSRLLENNPAMTNQPPES